MCSNYLFSFYILSQRYKNTPFVFKLAILLRKTNKNKETIEVTYLPLLFKQCYGIGITLSLLHNGSYIFCSKTQGVVESFRIITLYKSCIGNGHNCLICNYRFKTKGALLSWQYIKYIVCYDLHPVAYSLGSLFAISTRLHQPTDTKNQHYIASSLWSLLLFQQVVI